MTRFGCLLVGCLIIWMSLAQGRAGVIASQYVKLVTEGQMLEAQNLLKEGRMTMVSELGNDWLYNRLLADSYMNLGSYKTAAQTFDLLSEYANYPGATDDAKATKAKIFDDWGYCLQQTGDIGGAEQHYLKCIEIMKGVGDKERWPQLRLSLMHLGDLYASLLMPKEALQNLSDAKYLHELNLDFGLSYVNTLANMSLLYVAAGDNLTAKMVIDTARKHLLGIKTPCNINGMWLACLSNASSIYQQLRLTNEANQFLDEVATIFERDGADRDSQEALTIMRAVLALAQQDYPAAKKLLRNVNGKMLQVQPMFIFSLAASEFVTGDDHAANTSAWFLKTLRDRVLRNFSFMSAEQRDEYWANFATSIQGAQFMMSHSDKPLIEDVYDAALFSKGLLLRHSSHITQAVAQSHDSNLKHAYSQLNYLKEAVAQNAADDMQMRQMTDSIVILEKFLSRKVTSFTSVDELAKEFDWHNVRDALASGEVAIEFIEMPDTVNTDTAFHDIDYRYYAAIVNHESREPWLISLCSENELNDVLSQNTRLKSLENYIAQLYTQQKGPKNWQGDKLYELLWHPIADKIKDVHTIYYSPIGTLNRIAFAALTTEGVPLAERHILRQLTSTSEVARIKNRPTNRLTARAYVVGGVDYDGDTDALIAEARNYGQTDKDIPQWDRGSAQRAGWNALPATHAEADSIAAYLRVQGSSVTLLTGMQANEESFKALSRHAPPLIHLATHGFYLPCNNLETKRNPFVLSQASKKREDALLRSGLILAGGNRAWSAHDPIPDIEDGVLTADEISHMDLSGAETVVLSACQSALGDISEIEGIYGLQRALKMAGVQTIIMSLWKVADEATSQLMRIFYKYWLTGMERHHAFAKAQADLRLQQPNPYFWAPFVMLD